MPPMRAHSPWLPVLFAVLAGLTACDSKDDPAKDETKLETKTVYACEIIVAPKAGEPESFKGSAQGGDEAEVEEQAWEAACGALPEADRGDCRDTKKWKWASGGGSAVSGGVKNVSRTITLTRVVEPVEHSGEVESEASDEAACKEALSKACEAAGAKGDCVAAGTHEQRGRRSSKETRTSG